MLTSPRVTLSKSKLHRNPSVVDRISIIAEVTDRVTNKFKSKGPPEVLPQDYWDFIPHENQPLQPNPTKIILSPYQVMYFSAIQFNNVCSLLACRVDFDSASTLCPFYFFEKRFYIIG